MSIEAPDAYTAGIPHELREQCEALSRIPDLYFWTDVDIARAGEKPRLVRIPFRESEVEAIKAALAAHRNIAGAVVDLPGDGPKAYLGEAEFPSLADLQDRSSAVAGILMSARAAHSVLARGGFIGDLHAHATKVRNLPKSLVASPAPILRRR